MKKPVIIALLAIACLTSCSRENKVEKSTEDEKTSIIYKEIGCKPNEYNLKMYCDSIEPYAYIQDYDNPKRLYTVQSALVVLNDSIMYNITFHKINYSGPLNLKIDKSYYDK